MSGRRRHVRATSVTFVLAALMLVRASVAAQSTGQDRGESLADALLALQAAGLRVVFSSAIVTPDLRVDHEPRATTPRQRLDELLAPHGLKAVDGSGGVIRVVRAEPRTAEPRTTKAAAPPSSDATGMIEGRVIHALTRQPLADVIVRVDGVTPDVRTDATGRFVVRDVDAGIRSVHASTDGFLLVTRVVHVTRGSEGHRYVESVA